MPRRWPSAFKSCRVRACGWRSPVAPPSTTTSDADWRPRLELEQALGWTVEWYKAHLRSEDMYRLTLEQIERYEQMEMA